MKRLVRALRHPHDYRWWELRPFQRHSLVLGVAGTVYILLGAVWLLSGATPQQEVGLKLALNFVPFELLATAWICVGLLALLSSRWPPASKTWGYSAIAGLAVFWSAIYVVGVLLFGAPTIGLTAALVWALMGFLWWAIAGLVNPDDILAMVDDIMTTESDDSEAP